MIGDREKDRADAAALYAWKVQRDNLEVASPRAIDAWRVAADAAEEAGDHAGAENHRAYAARLEEVLDLMWRSSTETLDERWPCGCCCEEHTHGGCPARLWGGCRGQGADDANDYAEWIAHYERFHSIPRAVFEGREP